MLNGPELRIFARNIVEGRGPTHDGVHLLAIFEAAATFGEAVRLIRRRDRTGARKQLLLTAALLLTVSPWLLWNLGRFGFLLAESGKATRSLSPYYGMKLVTGEGGFLPVDRVPARYYEESRSPDVPCRILDPFAEPRHR